MNISNEGIEFIKQFEGCRLKAYQDSVGVWTLGVGHTGGVKEGDEIDDAEADRLLREDLVWVEKCIANSVREPLTQNQYDALCSWIFNLGCGAFKKSTLLAHINEGEDALAAKEILKWNRAGGNVISGLTRRREAESELFLS